MELRHRHISLCNTFSSVFSLTNSKPSVLIFNKKLFIEAFTENKKERKLLVKKVHIRMQQYSQSKQCVCMMQSMIANTLYFMFQKSSLC